MPKAAPEYEALTLRFKHGKHTILLLVDPQTSFVAVKEELLAALHDRYPDGLPTTTTTTTTQRLPIPTDQADVRLGVPENVHEPHAAGWSEVDTQDLASTPEGVGLQDGGVLAFAFVSDERGAEDFSVEWSNYDAGEEPGEDDDADEEAGSQ